MTDHPLNSCKGKATEVDRMLQLAERRCHQQGARLTARRRRVLEILCQSERPLSAYQILEELRDGAPLAPPTVYRALDFLLEQGLIHKLETLHAFVGCNHPDHPHASQFLICADCGGVTEIEDASLSDSVQVAASRSGFKPRRSVVEVLGLCAYCSETQRVASTASEADGNER
ncbi:transcriptional repressor [Thiorhodovibrio frisius]|uniref:Fe2+/Zn2+ uptake regulation protein n=1 Tax=Thiorhodovibrio frisius TaxID=631362 RepID=H8YZS7_9GAMM|nr:transcriptional repressor [Thiorhodovibrio frisius]EIC22204.1 Fe2+/Zn2+ uptake regulation protein [Thiorhodovibrio frisius]WPL24498.1 Zinc uptake regulation protein [Thiorhodovibrio frisius]